MRSQLGMFWLFSQSLHVQSLRCQTDQLCDSKAASKRAVNRDVRRPHQNAQSIVMLKTPDAMLQAAASCRPEPPQATSFSRSSSSSFRACLRRTLTSIAQHRVARATIPARGLRRSSDRPAHADADDDGALHGHSLEAAPLPLRGHEHHLRAHPDRPPGV